MSTVCSGNPSVPRSGTPSSLVIDAAHVQSLLPPALAYLYPFLPWMHGLAIGNVGDFCAADPPTLGLPDSSDFLALISGGPLGAAQVVSEFLADVTRHFLWYQICQCTVVSTPNPPTPPANPGDLPAVNPPGVVNPPGLGPCATWVSPEGSMFSGSVSTMLLGTRVAQGGPVVPVPAGTTTLRLVMRVIPAGATHYAGSFIFRPALAFNDEEPGTQYIVASGATSTVDIVWNPLHYGFTVEVARDTGGVNVTDLGQVNAYAYCGGQPGQLIAPCCPPDQIATGLLQQILDYVELIQRQVAPFAYVYGSNHTGLTGDGEFAVSGLLGVSIDVTTLPDRVGLSAGTPETLFDVGYVTLGSADGWERSRRIDREGALIVPPSGGVYTRVGYTLTPGVTIAIRELVREP